jgi:hypothetical protein
MDKWNGNKLKKYMQHRKIVGRSKAQTKAAMIQMIRKAVDADQYERLVAPMGQYIPLAQLLPYQLASHIVGIIHEDSRWWSHLSRQQTSDIYELLTSTKAKALTKQCMRFCLENVFAIEDAQKAHQICMTTNRPGFAHLQSQLLQKNVDTFGHVFLTYATTSIVGDVVDHLMRQRYGVSLPSFCMRDKHLISSAYIMLLMNKEGHDPQTQYSNYLTKPIEPIMKRLLLSRML